MAISVGGPLPSDFRENQERKELRKFQVGDKVKVVGSDPDADVDVDKHLQKNNRIGTIIRFVDVYYNYCYLCMERPVIEDVWVGHKARHSIPEEYAYLAHVKYLELIEPVESQESFNIDQWRKNLKPGDKVRVVIDSQEFELDKLIEGEGLDGIATRLMINRWMERKDCVVTLKARSGSIVWTIEEDDGDVLFASRWFEPVGKGGSLKSRKTKESRKKVLDPRLKTLIQTALKLTQTTEKTFKDSKKYPIFGINLAAQEPEEKTRKSSLGESLLSLGVVLYHLYTGQSEHNNHGFLLDGYSKPEDMPEGFWRIVNKLLGSEYRSLDDFKDDLKKWQKVLKEGVVEDLGKSDETIENREAKKIWQTQVDRLIELGYHKALNMTEEEFANSDLIPLPDLEMKNPIVVVPGATLGLKKQTELIEVDGKHGYCNLAFTEVTTEVFPRIYWIDLIQDGRGFLGRSPKECLKDFGDNERGLTTAEGIALIAQHPQTLKDHNIDIVGSRWHSAGRALTIWLGIDGKPILGLSSDEETNPRWGPPSCRINAPKQTTKDSS